MTLALTTTVSGTVSVENLDLASVDVAAGLPASLQLDVYEPFRYYGMLMVGTATARGTASLAAYDGSSDFAGASGIVLSGLSGTSTETASFLASDYAAGLFIGTGQIQLEARPATSLGLSAGANLRAQSAISAIAAEVALTYEYTPAGGTGGSVITTGGSTVTLTPNPQAVTGPTVTGARQLREVPAQTTGWTAIQQVDGFDPALGTLAAVNLRLANALDIGIAMENQGPSSGFATVTQNLGTTIAVAGQPGALATARAEISASLFLDAADGIDDFAGTGGGRIDGISTLGNTAVRLSDPATLAAFSGARQIDLSLHAKGTGIIQGVADLLAELQGRAAATLEISYTYAPSGPFVPIAMANATTGAQTQPSAASYTGPVAGIVNAFVQITSDSLAVSAASDSWYIRTGSGTDAIQVVNGTNVLDGGGGSNFLTGGEGQDTFFVDASVITAPVWNTIAGFSSGDAATIWGITPEGFRLTWLDGLGAAGATGLTLNARAPGRALVSTTFAGYNTTDLNNGRLAISYGAADDLPYMHIRAL